MISLEHGREDARPELLDLAERLEALAADLRAVAAGTSPSAGDLSSAPLLDAWRVVDWPIAKCLVGTTTGHPRLRGRLMRTSDVWALNVEEGWARTLSRFYRLGRPAEGAPSDGEVNGNG